MVCYKLWFESCIITARKKRALSGETTHGQFWRNIAEVRDVNKDLVVTEKKGIWLQMEMEDMIMAAQDQALRTNTIKTTHKQNVPV